MEQKRENPVNKTDVQYFEAVQTPEYAILGKYIPVHRYDKKNQTNNNMSRFVITPSEPHKFCIYEGDYERKIRADKKQLYQNYLKNLMLSIKLIFIGRIN